NAPVVEKSLPCGSVEELAVQATPPSPRWPKVPKGDVKLPLKRYRDLATTYRKRAKQAEYAGGSTHAVWPDAPTTSIRKRLMMVATMVVTNCGERFTIAAI